MDRDTFPPNRRGKNTPKNSPSFQSFSSSQSSNNNNQSENRSQNFRRNLRTAYLNEGKSADFRNAQTVAAGGHPNAFINSSMARNTPDATSSSRHSLFSDSTPELTLQLASLGFDKKGPRMSAAARQHHHQQLQQLLQQQRGLSRLPSLPVWALDENHEIRCDLTLEKVVDEGLILMFAMDKSGCHFLQSNYYGDNTPNVAPFIRDQVSRQVLGSKDIFHVISKNIFGNFFLQRVIEYSNSIEQEIVTRYLIQDMIGLCLDKSACRVVQTALEKLPPHFGDVIVAAIPRNDSLLSICVDQNGNHVIQKVVKKMPLEKWEFLVHYLCKAEQENMLLICQDKYGCRVVQTIVEVLSSESKEEDKTAAEEKTRMLHRLMSKIVAKCPALASNEFANYVIQHIISTPGPLDEYRNAIIETCLLRNLLSMSQEKFASHVIERAFVFAPISHIAEMMEEIFDGYVPHPDTGKDALDILLFHQFGNYVVQRMLEICVTAVTGRRETIVDGVDFRDKFMNWLSKLCVRARKERSRLARFSSGKKIIDIMHTMETKYLFVPTFDCNFPLAPPPLSAAGAAAVDFSSLFTPESTTATTKSHDWPPSRTTSISSDPHHHQNFDFNTFNNNFSKF